VRLKNCFFQNKKLSGPLKLCKHYNCRSGGILNPGWIEWWPQDNVSWVGSEYNDSISQIKVIKGVWRFYEHRDYRGRHLDLGPGVYKLKNHNFNDIISSFKRLKPVSATAARIAVIQ